MIVRRFFQWISLAPFWIGWLGSAKAQDIAAQSLASPGDKGDTAWMLVATALVLLMAIPGLALFYGGLVRAKNMLSVLTQVFAIVSIVGILWVIYGYSITFSNGGAWNAFVGGFSKLFLKGVTPATGVATFSNGVYIPEFAYVCFQMTFAMITPALIVGAFAERVKFSALVIFIVLWVTFVYFPLAHMVWYWGGPDAWAAASKASNAVVVAGGNVEAAARALAAATRDAGLLYQWGALDFAGGTVVHVNAGIAGLVGALIIGKRVGYGKEAMPPHSLTMTMIGASLLWVGWFGFNAGSALEANGTAALAMINTFVAAAAAAVAWLFVEWTAKGKPSLLGMVSGAVAGLVAITPACGFAGPMGAIVLGALASIVCFFFVSTVKNALGYDDSLDVFGVHCVGGILGAIATGILVNPSLGGTGIPDYLAYPGMVSLADYSPTQIWVQMKAVLVTLAWSGVGSLVFYKLVDSTMGLRVPVEQEREGLDVAEHGERAYS